MKYWVIRGFDRKIEILGFSIEILGSSFEILGISKICGNCTYITGRVVTEGRASCVSLPALLLSFIKNYLVRHCKRLFFSRNLMMARFRICEIFPNEFWQIIF